MTKVHVATATSVLKHFGLMGSIAIVDENNISFIGDLMRSSSKMRAEKYFNKRDEYREGKGKVGIWKGSSASMIYKMMGKTGSMEDRSAVNRIGMGKRWKMSRHNLDVCQACGEDSRSINHGIGAFKEENIV